DVPPGWRSPACFARVKAPRRFEAHLSSALSSRPRSRVGAPSDQVGPRVRSRLSGEGPNPRDPALPGLRSRGLHPDPRRAGPEERMGVRSESRRELRRHLRPRSPGLVLEGSAGEWAEGRVICFGFLKRVRAGRITTVGPVLESGSRLIGAVRVNSKVEIDFGLFQSELAFASDEERRKILNEAGLRDGSYVATDVGVDIELKRWGSKETI